MARARDSLTSVASATSLVQVASTHPDLCPSNRTNKNPSAFHGSFQFSSSGFPVVGNQHKRGDCGDSRGRDLRDQSKPDACDGLV